MKINTNIASINAQKNLNRAQDALQTPLQRLSSAKRINSAKDDAAGLAIVARMTTQLLGNQVAIRNTNDGISLAQTAEGALSEAGNMLQRMRELAVQSLNATNSPADRQALQAEVSQLGAELNRIAGTTEFNGQKLLDGSFGSSQFQVGANAGQTITATTESFNTDQYGDQHLAGTTTTVGTVDRIAAGGSLDIHSASGSATANYQAGDSAAQLSQEINRLTDQTGVTASAETEVNLSFSAAGSYRLELSTDNGNTQNIGFNLSDASGTDSLTQAVNAFNDQAGKTGVVATVNEDGSGITLKHNEGETIRLSDTVSANTGTVTVTDAGGGTVNLNADTIADTVVATGQVKLNADQSFAVSASAAGDVISGSSQASSLQAVQSVDISTVPAANDALAIVDSAIARVSSQRANYGALQSRFEASIRNNENYVENLAAARSRILDTDYAKETAELTRSMILNKAGTAVLGQANMNAKLVIGLLNKRS